MKTAYTADDVAVMIIHAADANESKAAAFRSIITADDKACIADVAGVLAAVPEAEGLEGKPATKRRQNLLSALRVELKRQAKKLEQSSYWTVKQDGDGYVVAVEEFASDDDAKSARLQSYIKALREAGYTVTKDGL